MTSYQCCIVKYVPILRPLTHSNFKQIFVEKHKYLYYRLIVFKPFGGYHIRILTRSLMQEARMANDEKPLMIHVYGFDKNPLSLTDGSTHFACNTMGHFIFR